MRVENIEKAPSAVRSLVEYIDEVERIQDGTLLPRGWRWYRRWLALMPMARLKGRVNRVEAYYVERFGYVRKKDADGYAADVYEVDQRCVGAICTVVILAWGGLGIHEISKATGMWVKLCPRCHARVHADENMEELLKKEAQALFEEEHSHEEFIELFRKNYL